MAIEAVFAVQHVHLGIPGAGPLVEPPGDVERFVAMMNDRARRLGARVLWLSTEPEMHAAHQLYQRLGFTRTPEHDWTPLPGVLLLTYTLPLG